MSETTNKIRLACIMFFSAITVLYCIYTNFLYPPSSFVHRGFYLAMAFILYYLTRLPRGKNAWDNALFSLATAGGVAVCIYMAIEEQRISDNYYRAEGADFYVFLVFILSIMIVISRMSGGKIVAFMGLIGTLYVYMGHYVPGLFGHNPFSISQSTMMVLTDVDKGALGDLVGLLARLLSIFLMFAALLLATGLGELVNALAARLLGHLKGGPAKIAVVSSALFGTISGSPVANVAATGSFTIPLMKKIGYPPTVAGAIEACASSGGELMPPVMGPTAFIMSEILGISYGIICLWGIVPAFLWYWSVYWVVHYNAWKWDVAIWSPPKEESMRTIKETAHLALAIVLFLIFLWTTRIPEIAVFWAVIALFVLSSLRKATRLNGKRMSAFLENFAESFSGIGLLLSIVGIFVSALTSTGFHVKIGMVLFGGMHHWALVALFAFLLCVVFGMAMPVVAAYLAVVLIVAPVMKDMGFPLPLTHMLIFYACCLAPLTPPVAMAAYTASSISGADPMKTAVTATAMGFCLWLIPFLLFRYGVYFGMATPIIEVITFMVIAAVGVYTFILGSIGYFKGHLHTAMRATFVCLGLLCLQPLHAVLSGIAAAVSVLLIVFLTIRHRQKRGPALSAAPV
jgi:TRAP transporter 4TM/12TM fusion protein